MKPKHWQAIEDYCNGKRLRGICDKYKVHDGHIVKLAVSIGITPRPTGFASYEIAHEWVQKARLEYAKAKAANEQQPTAQRDENYKFCPRERWTNI